MDRLTIPDEHIEGGIRRTVIDARAVRKEAMTIYWALKKYEDTGLTPKEIMEERIPKPVPKCQSEIPVIAGAGKRTAAGDAGGQAG